MQNLKSFRTLLIVALVTFCNFYQAAAQTHTPKYISTGPNSNGFYEYLPQGYNPSGSTTYPLIVFIHGIGELGNGSTYDLGKLLWAGIPSAINTGQFPVSLTVNGKTHKFIVISPQFINWPSPMDIDQVINYAAANYKVDLTRVYLTGLSMGGGAVWEYAGAGGNYTNRLAAIAPICGASWPEYTRARNIANANLPVWAFHNQGDGTVPVSYTNDYIAQINQAPAPNPLAKKTIFPVGGHDAWTNVYTSNYSESGLTVYQWLLQYQKGTPPPAYNNQSPTANAGPDQIATPGAAVQLNGSGSDPDGSIASYNWTKVSGPAQFTFSNANIASPSVSGLVPGVYTFRLTVTDNLGSTASDDVVINVPVSLPAKIEAENYWTMSGIQTENTLDIGGGKNVGWQDNGDWMEYPVYVPQAGTYTVNFRVAAVYNGPQFQLRKSDGTVLATVTVPATLNVQTWTTVSAQVTLPAGQQMLRVVTTNANGGWNFNWMEFVSSQTAPNQPPVVNAGTAQTITLPASTATLNGSANDPDGSIATYKWTLVSGPSTPAFSASNAAVTQVSGLVQGTYTFKLTATDNKGASASANVTVTVNAASTPPPTSSIKIEAENYSSMFGIQTEPTQDVGGGMNVGWQDDNDWMEYTVNLAASGTYTVNFRVASYFQGAQFQVKKADGSILTTVTVPKTGSFQTWTTVSAQVNLPAGQQTLRIVTSAANGGWNINWFEIAGASTGNPPTEPEPNPTPTPPPATSIRIEAEDYIAMNGIQTENTSDAGGGKNVGWQDNNDWMEYSVNLAAAGSYTVNFRVASYFTGAQFQLRNAAGQALTTVTVPNTGSFQTWTTVSAQVTLPAGQQKLRIVTTNANGGWNINWWEITGASTNPPDDANPVPPPPTSIRIEAENYTAMNGIQTENTSDAGGGKNVGWQDNNDWMDYSVNIPAAGSYTVNFRVASYFTGAQFQLRNSAGNALATITVPNTGNFQTWTTVSAQVTLPAGQQTLRIVTTNANGGWNINWWEIVSGQTAARPGETTVQSQQVSVTSDEAVSLQLYPNPTTDRVIVKVNNELTGKVQIQLVDMKGAVVRQFALSKSQAGMAQFYLSLGDVPNGQYLLKVDMKDFSKTTKVVKQ